MCIDTERRTACWGPVAAVDSQVAALAVAGDDVPSVLVVGTRGAAAVLDLASGRVMSRFQALKHGARQVAAVSGTRALVGGSTLVLLDVAAGGRRLRKWAGHAAGIVALAVTPDSAFACSTGQGEPDVAVWSLAGSDGGAGKPKLKTAVATVGLQQPAVELACSAVHGGAFFLAAVLRDGGVAVFRVAPDAAAAGRAGGSSQLVGEVLSSSQVFHAAVEGNTPAGVDLAVAAGNPGLPALHRVHISKADADSGKTRIDLPGGGGLFDGPAAGTQQVAPGRPGVAAAAVLGVPSQAVLPGKMGVSSKRPAADGEDEDAMAFDAAEDDEAEEPTLGERVRALEAGATPPATRSEQEQQQQQRGWQGAPVKADSLSVLLTQALRTRDDALLDKCMSVGHEATISNTVQRLLPADAGLLVKAVLVRLQSAPGRGEQLAAWVRTVLLHHTGYLVGLQGMQASLNYLYQLIEARLAAFQPLLALSGRLDVLLVHAKCELPGAAGHMVAADGPLVMAEVGANEVAVVDGLGELAGDQSLSKEEASTGEEDDEGEDELLGVGVAEAEHDEDEEEEDA
eukprot:scaffold8.g1574.t1